MELADSAIRAQGSFDASKKVLADSPAGEQPAVNGHAWILRGEATHGPYTVEQLRSWVKEGVVSSLDRAYSEASGWTTVARVAGIESIVPPPPIFAAQNVYTPVHVDEDEAVIQQIVVYQRISAIVWAVIALLQIVSVVAVIAGIWNAYAAYTRFRGLSFIESRSKDVPASFESITGLVIIGVINLFFGAVFGVVGVVMDFVVRNYVLKHQHLFNREDTTAQST